VVLDRSQAYTGVLIDDLVNKGTNEPYRMFTSRAEFRLHLRIDNADRRLTPIGRRVGLIGEQHYRQFLAKQERIARTMALLGELRADPNDEACAGIFAKLNGAGERATLAQLLKRPEIGIEVMAGLVERALGEPLSRMEMQCAETEVKYEGYLAQQQRQIERLRKAEARRIPPDFDYRAIAGLSREIRDKLERIRPLTLGQAERIPGVTPAAIAILSVYTR